MTTTPARHVRVAWLLAGSVGAALVALYALAVWTVGGQVVDTRLMLATGALLGEAVWTEALLNLISPASVVAVLCLLVAVGFALRGPVVAATVSATVIGTLLGSELLKHVLIRPAWLDDAGNSLPSGHVSAVAALAVSAYIAVPRAGRGAAMTAGLVAVGSTSLATMALGWHRPSDAVASTLLAVGVCAAVTATATSAPVRRRAPELLDVGTR